MYRRGHCRSLTAETILLGVLLARSDVHASAGHRPSAKWGWSQRSASRLSSSVLEGMNITLSAPGPAPPPAPDSVGDRHGYVHGQTETQPIVIDDADPNTMAQPNAMIPTAQLSPQVVAPASDVEDDMLDTLGVSAQPSSAIEYASSTDQHKKVTLFLPEDVNGLRIITETETAGIYLVNMTALHGGPGAAIAFRQSKRMDDRHSLTAADGSILGGALLDGWLETEVVVEIEQQKCLEEFTEGRRQGFQDGYHHGFFEGHTQGSEQGIEYGRSQGFAMGVESGQREECRFAEGFENWYRLGYVHGYDHVEFDTPEIEEVEEVFRDTSEELVQRKDSDEMVLQIALDAPVSALSPASIFVGNAALYVRGEVGTQTIVAQVAVPDFAAEASPCIVCAEHLLGLVLALFCVMMSLVHCVFSAECDADLLDHCCRHGDPDLIDGAESSNHDEDEDAFIFEVDSFTSSSAVSVVSSHEGSTESEAPRALADGIVLVPRDLDCSGARMEPDMELSPRTLEDGDKQLAPAEVTAVVTVMPVGSASAADVLVQSGPPKLGSPTACGEPDFEMSPRVLAEDDKQFARTAGASTEHFDIGDEHSDAESAEGGTSNPKALDLTSAVPGVSFQHFDICTPRTPRHKVAPREKEQNGSLVKLKQDRRGSVCGLDLTSAVPGVSFQHFDICSPRTPQNKVAPREKLQNGSSVELTQGCRGSDCGWDDWEASSMSSEEESSSEPRTDSEDSGSTLDSHQFRDGECFEIEAAGGHVAACNGVYTRCGSCNNRPLFTSTRGAIVFFDHYWKMSAPGCPGDCVFFSRTGGRVPPTGQWPARHEPLAPITLTVRRVPSDMPQLPSLCTAADCQVSLYPHNPLNPGEVEVTQITAQDGKICFKLAPLTITAPAILTKGQGNFLGFSVTLDTVPEPAAGVAGVAESGDGSLENVGLRVHSQVQCPDCRQRFDSEKAKNTHWKFVHDVCGRCES